MMQVTTHSRQKGKLVVVGLMDEVLAVAPTLRRHCPGAQTMIDIPAVVVDPRESQGLLAWAFEHRVTVAPAAAVLLAQHVGKKPRKE